MKTKHMKIKLGDHVRDKVSGFEGIAVAKVKYLNGCLQFGIKSKIGSDGKMPESEYVDWQQLERIDKGIDLRTKQVGGPQSDCPKH